VFILLSKIKEDANYFDEAKKTAFIGLFMGFLLYMIGFIVVGGEWFSMWQSSTWNGQMKAGLFISLIMFVMLFIKNSDASEC
jgi:predicted small integral membrane protein